MPRPVPPAAAAADPRSLEPLEPRRLFAVVTVRGTSAADAIEVFTSGTSYRVTVTPAGATPNDGTIQDLTYDAAGVTGFNVQGGNGGDFIRVASNINLPTSLLGEAGNDTLVGGGGSDYLYGEDDNDQVYGLAGNDILVSGAGKNTLFGGDGNDRLTGSSGRDTLAGEGGNDRLYGGNSDDRLDGGSGVDRLYGQGGADFLLGGSSNDRLFGDIGRDTLYGGNGNNYLDGGADDDTGEKRTNTTLVSIETVL